MTTTFDKLNAKLPRFSGKYRGDKRDRIKTSFGPGFYNCTGTGLAPMLHHFPTEQFGSVFIVGVCMSNPDDLFMTFHKASWIGKAKATRIRKLKMTSPCRGGDAKWEYKVFYNRKSAVTEFARLTDEATARNARLAAALSR